MNCPSCQRANPDGAKFCNGCGNAIVLLHACAACGVENAPGSNFCHSCGTAIASESQHLSRELPESFDGGRYVTKTFLGEGGRKRVYLARDRKLARDVAIAEIKTDALEGAGVERVKREAQAMARLGDHPNIVTIFDIAEQDSTMFVVSQYMGGGDVSSLIAAAPNQQMPLAQVISLAEQVCRGLEHAHSNSIIHRDIKPANVWLTEDGSAKIGDFGLAMSAEDSRLTLAGMMVGSVSYMPPEQAVGRQADARSDLYSLGVMMYEMVTGRPPFVGDDIVSIISQHINTAPVAPSWHRPDVPRALEALILKLLAKAPEDRLQDAGAVREALKIISDAPQEKLEALLEANPLDRLAGGIFVGREKELEELRGCLTNALSGRGGTAMLIGEPGIGKTRITEEITTYARLRNMQVLWGRCYESEGVPAYWPWIQIVRSYISDRPADILTSEMGSGAPDIAQVVSDVREHIPGLPEAPFGNAEHTRFRFFDGITQFLKNASKAQPLLIVLDDLHWADKSSLMLLQFVSREIRSSRVMILGTYRDIEVGRQHPLAETLAELNREQLIRRIHLRGISAEDIGKLIQMTAGVKAQPALVDAVLKQTEGNPFFINEIVRLLVTDGRLDSASTTTSWSVTIPQSVRDVIGKRLDHLSEACNHALTVAALIGREFEVAVLKEVADLGEDQMVDLLDEAMAGRIIAEVPKTPGQYVFTHALIRETLAGELSALRRARMHRQIADKLESLYGRKPESHLAQLAYHFFEGIQQGDTEKAVLYCRMAGDKALASVAYQEGATHYENALQALRLEEGPDRKMECELLIALADAFVRAGQPESAKTTYDEAATVARAERLPEQLTLAALGLGGLIGFGLLGNPHLVSLLEEAIETLPDDRYDLQSRARARLAQDIGGGDNPEEARGLLLAEEALLLARKSGDRVAIVRALAARYSISNRPETMADRLPVSTEMVKVADNSGDRELQLQAHALHLIALFDAGHLTEADTEFELTSLSARELRQPLYSWYSTIYTSTRAQMQGRFAEAEGLAAQAFAQGQGVDAQLALRCFSVQMLLIRRDQGRLAELEAQLKAFAAGNSELPVLRAVLSNVYKELRRPDEARSIFRELMPRGFSVFPSDNFRLIALAQLAEVAAYLSEEEGARLLYDALLPYADRHLAIFPSIGSLGACAQYLGQLAATLGRWEKAERHFIAALTANKDLGSKVATGRTQCAFAEMLMRRADTGDRERAGKLLEEALAVAQEIGAKAIVDSALALKVGMQGLTNATPGSSIDSVMQSVTHDKPDLRSHAAPDGTVTLMFSDIEGSTVLTEKLGDKDWMQLLHEHNAIIRRNLKGHRGFEVKSEGDGFMMAFNSALHALRCAIGVQRELAARNADSELPIRVRMGLHTGEVVKEANDFFGKNVILAARIAAKASGGQILASSVVEAIAASSREVTFANPQELELKGLEGTYRVFDVNW
jgi:class 3 adenylate cyclase